MLSAEIRAAINKKARLYQQDDEIPPCSVFCPPPRRLFEGDDLQPSTYMKALGYGRKGMKHSTAANNPEGLLEKEIKAREQREEQPGRKYRKRHRKEISAVEIVDIVHCYMVQNVK